MDGKVTERLNQSYFMMRTRKLLVSVAMVGLKEAAMAITNAMMVVLRDGMVLICFVAYCFFNAFV